VNSTTLIEKYKGTAEVKKQIEAETKELTARVDTLMMEFQNELKKYEKERAAMSPKEKELQEQLLQKKQGEFQGYRDATDKKVKEKQLKITQEMLNKINDFIKDYAKGKNYKLIIAGNASGNVLYAADIIDITDEVVEAVNVEYLKTK
jgi:outer membrane protein